LLGFYSKIPRPFKAGYFFLFKNACIVKQKLAPLKT